MTSRTAFPLIDHQPRRAWLWALALGVISAAGFQPLGLWPLALLAAGAGVMLIARAATARQAAWLGWLFGVGHFTLANNWIATAFTHQAEMPAFIGWIAVPGLALYLAIYPALAAFAARMIVRSGPGWAYALVFAGTWIISEWLRSWVFSGYAWNPFAMVLLGPLDRPGLAAIAPVMGTYALSGVAMLLSAALLLLMAERRWRLLGLVAVLLAAGMYWPAARVQNSELRVTVVQPNLTQDRLQEPALYEPNFLILAGLSPALRNGAGETGPRIVLWPESGLADYLREGYPQRYYDRTTAFANPVLARRRLGSVVGQGSVLLTGAVDLEIGEVDGRPAAIGARNSVTVVSAQGDILGSYSKAHLVPGGEYLPLREYLEPLGLSRLVPGSFDFWPGPGPRTLDLGEFGNAGVQICYEIIFSGQVSERAYRPDYIFNDSNDGWFGTFGPPQHLAQARMRAVEEGLPVLRSTTTGISAVIDAGGVVRQHLGAHVVGRIDTFVPAAAPPTLFAKLGNGLALFWAAVFLGLGLVAMRKRRG
jgi:apolipoprotein N-acyltransferase